MDKACLEPKRILIFKASALGLISAIIILAAASTALAHSPLGTGNNESLATASYVPDPTKSWAIYTELHEGGEAQYYKFNVTAGETIHVMLFKSTRPEDKVFAPGLVFMGPNVTDQGIVPDYVQQPLGVGVQVEQATQPTQATYEPFSPSSFYQQVDMNESAPGTGTYYVAVYEPNTGGHYGLAIGDRESYTLSEWLLIPINLLSVYQWTGQSPLEVIAPMVIIVVVGIGLLAWRWKDRRALLLPYFLLGTLASLLFLGTGVTVLLQMALALTTAPVSAEIAITLIFAAIPVILFLVTLRLVFKSTSNMTLRKRAYIAILGIIALFTWTGLIIGPIMAIGASLSPIRIGSEK